MATFSCNDIDGLILSMEEFARLPDNAIEDILVAGAEVVRKAHVEAIGSTFQQRTGQLMKSPAIVIRRDKGPVAYIYPRGNHHIYHAKGGGSTVASDQDVGFVHEFGGHGNPATAWMLNANEKCAEATVDAEEKALDKWLNSLNL